MAGHVRDAHEGPLRLGERAADRRAVTQRRCPFCEIVAGRAPAHVRYEDDEIIVIDNVLRWAPVMLLVMPKCHIVQGQLWQAMGRLGFIAVEMGRLHCPDGFRVLSNFGRDALQTQEHAHVHVVGGRFLGPYA